MIHSKKYTFEINRNINFNEINAFINFYKSELEKKSVNKSIKYDIKIIFNPGKNTEITGEVDPVYLSYVILFLADFEDSKITFIFTEYEDSDRAYSLKIQLEHIRYSLKINEKRLILKGKSKSNAITKNINLYSYNSTINKKTSEVLDTKEKIDNYFLKQSQKFIPPLFIDKSQCTIDKYFNSDYDYKNILRNKYLSKIKNIISEKVFSKKDRGGDDYNTYIQELKLNQLSYIEITIYLLLINEKTYEPLNMITDIEEVRRRKKNKVRVFHYIKYVKELASGIKELALNIKEHSTTHKGVITARIFDKKRLEHLKGHIENKFLNRKIGNEYITHNGEQFFLDINIIDFGTESIKEKYIKNLEENKNTCDHTLEINGNSEYKLDSNQIDKDKLYINHNYCYKDFFIIDFKKFKRLVHQQNKLISRFGLHHFTFIIQDNLNGLIKTSSQGEGVAFYKEFIQDNNLDITQRGTIYNCLIPLKIDFQKEQKNLEEYEDSHVQEGSNINTFETLDKFELLQFTKSNTQRNKIPIYKFDNTYIDNIKKENQKYQGIFSIYNFLTSSYSLKQKAILLINAKDLPVKNESNWIRLLSTLNNIYKDIIVYNIPCEIVLEIIKIRRYFAGIVQYDFWSNDSRVLFYSIRENVNNNYKRFGATVLAGKSIEHYNFINKNIWRHHYSYGVNDNFWGIDNLAVKEPHNKIYGKYLFHLKQLKYFELLIHNLDKNGSKISLFEESVQYTLNKKYDSGIKSSTKGYRIQSTHFRLGSKIHISDFYYAKILFQNSFFTTPLAYKLAKYLHENNNLSNKKKYSIIGYDKYSNFLISSIKNILEKKIKNIKINHFSINKDGTLSREAKYLNRNTIIVVPIVSTFSTSIKIKKDIDGIIHKFNDEILERVHEQTQDLLTNLQMEYDASDKTGINYIKGLITITKKFISLEGKLNAKNKLKDIKRYLNKIIELIPPKKNVNAKNKLKSFKEYLNEIKDEQVVNSFLNIILVGHQKIKKDKKLICFDDIPKQEIRCFDSGILNHFNWEKVDFINKLIEVDSFDNQNNESTTQKYFIPLYTNWKRAYKCNYCFPKKNIVENEKCLIETGTASITPQLIFGYPKTHITNESGLNKLNLNGSLLYGNLKNKNHNYLYFTKTDAIINEREWVISHENKSFKKHINKQKIIEWLNRIKEIEFKNYESEKTIIVTPSTSSNSIFLDLVNEHIFQYTANCIVISLEENYMENIESLYLDAFKNAEKIIYVDDILSTTKSFLKVSYIVEHIKDINKTGKSIDFCISLINRMSFYNENNILLRLKSMNIRNSLNRLFYFTKLNIPSIEELNNLDTLKKERKRLKILSSISSLDAVRQRFYKKRKKLNQIDLSKSIPDKVKDVENYNNKKLYQLLVFNALYSLFTHTKKSQQNKTNKFIGNYQEKNNIEIIFESSSDMNHSFEVLQAFIYERLKKEPNEHQQIINRYNNNLKYTILKIVCSMPLIFYKNIKESAFKWIIHDLDTYVSMIKNMNKKGSMDFSNFLEKDNDDSYSKFEVFKFLLKRSAQLKINYILSNSFFFAIEKLIKMLNNYQLPSDTVEKNEIQKDMFDNKGNIIKKYYKTTPKKFVYYLVSLIQELILGHETKAIKVEERVNKIIKNNNVAYNNNSKNGNFLHYLRLLKLENTEIFYKFWKYYKNENTKNTKIKIINNTIKIKDSYINNPIYKLVRELLKDEKDFQKFIDIKTSFNNKKIINKLEIKQSTNNNKINDFIRDSLLKKISSIIGNVKESYLTINYNKKKEQELNEDDLYIFKSNDENKILINLNESLTLKMFNGIIANEESLPNENKYNLSNLEIYKEKDDAKINIRNGLIINDSNILNISEINTLKKMDEFSILLVRISDFYNSSGNEKSKLYTQAVLTFYINKGGRIPEEKLRLILLLRNAISKFLKTEISTNTFLELLRYDEKNKHIRHLRHSIGKFTNFQFHLYDKLNQTKNSEKWKKFVADNNVNFDNVLEKDNKFEIETYSLDQKAFILINNSIKGQTGSSFTNLNINRVFFNTHSLKDLINTIFQSNYFGEKISISESIYKNKYNFKNLRIPFVVPKVIIPEIIINMKKYGINHRINWGENDKKLTFEFTNKFKREPIKKSNPGFGLKMSNDLCNNLHGITLNKPSINNSTYQIKLEVNKIESTNHRK